MRERGKEIDRKVCSLDTNKKQTYETFLQYFIRARIVYYLVNDLFLALIVVQKGGHRQFRLPFVRNNLPTIKGKVFNKSYKKPYGRTWVEHGSNTKTRYRGGSKAK